MRESGRRHGLGVLLSETRQVLSGRWYINGKFKIEQGLRRRLKSWASSLSEHRSTGIKQGTSRATYEAMASPSFSTHGIVLKTGSEMNFCGETRCSQLPTSLPCCPLTPAHIDRVYDSTTRCRYQRCCAFSMSDRHSCQVAGRHE